MKIVEQYSMLWKLTNKNYKRLLRNIASGAGYSNLDNYGKQIGIVDAYPLDMDADQAQAELNTFNKDQNNEEN